MKKLFTLISFTLFSLSFLSSCLKGGISGCTDPTASNYYSSATKDDGSCIYAGNVVFWTNSLSIHKGILTVTLDDGQSTVLTVNYTVAQQCVASTGGTIMTVPKGTHTYTTKDGFGITSSGTVVITTNGCTEQFLN